MPPQFIALPPHFGVMPPQFNSSPTSPTNMFVALPMEISTYSPPCCCTCDIKEQIETNILGDCVMPPWPVKIAISYLNPPCMFSSSPHSIYCCFLCFKFVIFILLWIFLGVCYTQILTISFLFFFFFVVVSVALRLVASFFYTSYIVQPFLSCVFW